MHTDVALAIKLYKMQFHRSSQSNHYLTHISHTLYAIANYIKQILPMK